MRKRWTTEEQQYLIENYNRLGPKKIGEQLGRPMAPVCKKARKLGLHRGQSAGNKERKNSWSFDKWSYDLGFLVGVYLGDGNIYIKKNTTATFRHNSIDKEFCLAVADKIHKVTGYNCSSLTYIKANDIWTLTFCNKDFVSWLETNFGGPKKKQIKLLPDIEANKGMIEGLFDSEGTVSDGYSFRLRMQGDITPITTILFDILGAKKGRNNQSGRKLKYCNLYSVTISCKEYTRLGLGTYIKKKARKNLKYKGAEVNDYCRFKDQCAKDEMCG